jgi:hypothetical protein
MAQSPTTPSITEDAFLADRQKFWRSFTSATFGTVIAVAVILVLLALFLL